MNKPVHLAAEKIREHFKIMLSFSWISIYRCAYAIVNHFCVILWKTDINRNISPKIQLDIQFWKRQTGQKTTSYSCVKACLSFKTTSQKKMWRLCFPPLILAYNPQVSIAMGTKMEAIHGRPILKWIHWRPFCCLTHAGESSTSSFLSSHTGNAAVLWCTCYTNVFKSVTNLFIKNLACSGICAGLVCVPFDIALSASPLCCLWFHTLLLCKAVKFLHRLFCSVTVLNFAVIALDRWTHIHSQFFCSLLNPSFEITLSCLKQKITVNRTVWLMIT